MRPVPEVPPRLEYAGGGAAGRVCEWISTGMAGWDHRHRGWALLRQRPFRPDGRRRRRERGARVQDRLKPLGPFVGRAAELARVAEVISRVEAGQPWLVAIEGDPGVGKTALARRSLAEAADLRVLSARADQAEADLDFGIVDQLLRAAGGVVPTATPNGTASSFSVGAGLLEVVGEQQAAAASAIVIDDLQWADRKSVEALTFMLRRLSVDPVIAIVTYRGRSDRLDEAAQRPPAGRGDRLDEAAQRLLSSVENRLLISLGGLNPDEIASLAVALRAGTLEDEVLRRL